MPRLRVGASKHLNRMPVNGAARPVAERVAPAPVAARRTSPSSSSSDRVAVAVLEVDPQVLDRLAAELGAHPRPRGAVAVDSSRNRSSCSSRARSAWAPYAGTRPGGSGRPARTPCARAGARPLARVEPREGASAAASRSSSSSASRSRSTAVTGVRPS